MPLGKVNSGDFRKGTPIILPHQFGNTVSKPMPLGNPIVQPNATLDGNPVTWVPSPSHFGNQVGYSLQCVPPVLVVAPGDTGTVDINITHLGNATSSTLSYSGAPAGVTVAFAPNPDATSSVATVTVGPSVPAGIYTITITGSASGETETTNIHLIVSFSGSLPSNGFELEDGSGVILLEDGSVLLLE